jgi:ubiquinone/menaquinone biosynthesis C-methylase UbiE
MNQDKEGIALAYGQIEEGKFMPIKFHRLCVKFLSIYFQEKSKVMDFGCGQGSLLEVLDANSQNLKLFGCDISKALCENAKTKVPGADIRTADLEHLPFEENSIDCGFATEVLEHMETPEKALKEMRRVLKPNSPLLVSLPNRDWLRFNEYIRYREKFQPVDDRFYSVSEMEGFLEGSGFKVVKVRGGENLYFGGGLPRLLEKVALFLFPHLYRKMKRMIIISEVIKS